MDLRLKLQKLNQQGFAHIFVAIACFATVTLIGTHSLILNNASPWNGALEVGKDNSGYCPTATTDSIGSPVVLNPCSKSASNNQIWTLTDIRVRDALDGKNIREFTLRSAVDSNQCLNDWGRSKAPVVQLRLHTCNSSDPASLRARGTTFVSQGFSSHQMANLAPAASFNSALCLDGHQWPLAPGARADLYICKESNQVYQEWFADAASSAPPSAPSSPGTSGSSVPAGGDGTVAPAMPTAAPAGFTRAFSEDFNTPAPLGSFNAVYGSAFGEYDGFKSTNGFTKYDSNNVLYVQNGSLYYDLHSVNGQSYAAAPQAWKFKSFRYGQVGMSVRLDSSTGPGYKIAFLLWPATNQWSNEVDFPEVDPDFTVPVRAVSLNTTAANGPHTFSGISNTGVHLTDNKYHTFLLDWEPGKMTVSVDGKVVENFPAKSIPTQPMRLSLQAEGWIHQGSIPVSTTDILEVPWVYINTYK